MTRHNASKLARECCAAFFRSWTMKSIVASAIELMRTMAKAIGASRIAPFRQRAALFNAEKSRL